MRWKWAALLGVLLGVMCWALPAPGHTKSASYSHVSLGQRVRVRLRVSNLDAAVLTAGAADRGRALAAMVSLTSGGAHCEPGAVLELGADIGWKSYEWEAIGCTAAHAPTSLGLDVAPLFAAIPGHVHFAAWSGEHGESERTLAAAVPRVDIVVPSAHDEAWVVVAARFAQSGARHVMDGLDHLLFLLVLALGVRSSWRMLVAATGFTVGHALTTTLAALGLVTTEASAVEALIAASIVLVAADNVWRARIGRDVLLPALVVAGLGAVAMIGAALDRPSARAVAGVALAAACFFGWRACCMGQGRAHGEPHAEVGDGRFAVSAVFGLVHGLGFASGLQRLELPSGRLAEAVLGFNIGVELAQLVLLGVAAVVLALLRHTKLEGGVLAWSSAVAVALGSYWLVERAVLLPSPSPSPWGLLRFF